MPQACCRCARDQSPRVYSRTKCRATRRARRDDPRADVDQAGDRSRKHLFGFAAEPLEHGQLVPAHLHPAEADPQAHRVQQSALGVHQLHPEVVQPGVLAAALKLVPAGTASVSPDGRHLAYATSESGSDWQTFRVRRVETADDLDDRLDWIKLQPAAWLDWQPLNGGLDAHRHLGQRYPQARCFVVEPAHLAGKPRP